MGLRRLLDSTPARLAGQGSDLLQLVVLAGTALAALSGVGTTWAVALHVPPATLVGVAAFLLAGSVLTYYVRCVYRPPDFLIEELDGSLVVTRVKGADGRSHHRYAYTRQQRVRATRQIRLVGIRSHWSGQNRTVEEATSLFPEHRLLDGAVAEEDGRVYRWLYLLGPLARGRRVSVGIRQVFEDAYAPMKPYYRESCEERPVGKLSVRVQFDHADAPAEAWHVVWRRTRSGSSRQEVARTRCRPSADQAAGRVVYALTLRRPDPECAYGIWWRWSEETSRRLASAPARPARDEDVSRTLPRGRR
ncbi:hypothetical protein [Micromonospora humi]|uniref:Uncharacterized protein n=1 Tax=Micromonospora humi TaxID=745366 RepID=A0A1C5H4H4_9ACTN|nr:hypothetical protein [Micromonospora humi]SCG40920.1 hypothetical protein GA0070213_102279 [Micromonospora humi]